MDTPEKPKSEEKMKKELTTKIYDKVFNIKENHEKINTFCKAVIINFGDERGDIIVANDNFGTRRKYADFTNGKIKANLHPLQIVFTGLDTAKAFGQKYINIKDEICFFKDLDK